jgi:hypothetical protein
MNIANKETNSFAVVCSVTDVTPYLHQVPVCLRLRYLSEVASQIPVNVVFMDLYLNENIGQSAPPTCVGSGKDPIRSYV